MRDLLSWQLVLSVQVLSLDKTTKKLCVTRLFSHLAFVCLRPWKQKMTKNCIQFWTMKPNHNLCSGKLTEPTSDATFASWGNLHISPPSLCLSSDHFLEVLRPPAVSPRSLCCGLCFVWTWGNQVCWRLVVTANLPFAQSDRTPGHDASSTFTVLLHLFSCQGLEFCLSSFWLCLLEYKFIFGFLGFRSAVLILFVWVVSSKVFSSPVVGIFC